MGEVAVITPLSVHGIQYLALGQKYFPLQLLILDFTEYLIESDHSQVSIKTFQSVGNNKQNTAETGHVENLLIY